MLGLKPLQAYYLTGAVAVVCHVAWLAAGYIWGYKARAVIMTFAVTELLAISQWFFIVLKHPELFTRK